MFHVNKGFVVFRTVSFYLISLLPIAAVTEAYKIQNSIAHPYIIFIERVKHNIKIKVSNLTKLLQKIVIHLTTTLTYIQTNKNFNSPSP